jgi:hypothetical protein
MTSTINNQQVYVQQLTTPQVTDVSGSPSIAPKLGSIVHSTTDPGTLYVGNGTNWIKLQSSSGGDLDNAVISNSKILSNNKIGNTSSITNGHSFTSLATTNTRNVFIPDVSGIMVLEAAIQTLTGKTIFNLTATGDADVLLNGRSIRFNVSGISTDNTPLTLALPSIPTGSSKTFKISLNGYCTAGLEAGGSISRVLYSNVKNTAGTVTVVGTNTFIFSQNSSGLNAATITTTPSGISIIIAAVGVVGDTISWSGYFEIIS